MLCFQRIRVVSSSLRRSHQDALCTLRPSLVHSYLSNCSAMDATLDTGGWLALTRQGLSPGKHRQASLGAITLRLRGAALFAASLSKRLLGCDTKSHEYLSRSSIEDLVFCHQYPTGTCAGSNPGVRSSRDNEALVCKDWPPNREGRWRLPASRGSGARVGGHG